MKGYLTIPRFTRLPFVAHGFGNAHWLEADFQKREEWKNFRLLFLKQVHSDIVHVVEEVPGHILRGDALLTHLPRLFLVVKTADCLPILLVDEMRRAVAAVHCGWQGTRKRLVAKVVESMNKRYGSNPDSLLFAFGPSIAARCYEVGEEVREIFRAERFPDHVFEKHAVRRGKYLLDLKGANRTILLSCGAKDENIFSLDICTHCDRDFLSYRRDKDRSGRMLNFIGIV